MRAQADQPYFLFHIEIIGWRRKHQNQSGTQRLFFPLDWAFGRYLRPDLMVEQRMLTSRGVPEPPCLTPEAHVLACGTNHSKPSTCRSMLSTTRLPQCYYLPFGRPTPGLRYGFLFVILSININHRAHRSRRGCSISMSPGFCPKWKCHNR